MLQREVFPYYRKCVSQLNEVYDFIKSQFSDGFVEKLCELRGYVSESQSNVIKSMNLGCADIDGSLLEEYDKDLNLLSKNGNFLLSGRFVIPVESVNGDLISLIGYYPDSRKYITLPTPFFAKTCLFFNFKQAYELSWSEYDGFVILVEGIFDCISLRGIGLPCIATMGASVSGIKCELLKLFKKVVAIPDDDTAGRRALVRNSKYGWNVPYNATFIKFTGGLFECGDEVLHCKDMDNFVSWYDEDDVREILLGYRDSKEEIEELVL